MIKKLVKHGNSWAVVIDRPILELLKIAPDSQVELTTEPKGNVLQCMTNGIQVHQDTSGIGNRLCHASLHQIIRPVKILFKGIKGPIAGAGGTEAERPTTRRSVALH
jgi:hypothetical protein